ncbi:MAG: tetratricopeptide repeat protein [Bacteroidota bacterium]|nr:tetratricopeptide repeat protein [Bacteroidota bacterium]
MAKNKQRDGKGFENIETSISSTEQFIEKNQKQLTIIFIVAIAVVSLFIAYYKWYKAPLEKEAQEQMYIAQQYFAADSFHYAINGDGEFPGFLDIKEDYGTTDASNIATLYLGISYVKTGQYQEAIDNLKSFDSDDAILGPLAKGNIGDAYNELGETEKAAKSYKEAAESDNNNFTAPIYYMKAARAFEALGNYKQALELYKIIKTDFPKSEEARAIDKYITRAELKL